MTAYGLVCTVGKTALRYDARGLGDLHSMLEARGDWRERGPAHVAQGGSVSVC